MYREDEYAVLLFECSNFVNMVTSRKKRKDHARKKGKGKYGKKSCNNYIINLKKNIPNRADGKSRQKFIIKLAEVSETRYMNVENVLEAIMKNNPLVRIFVELGRSTGKKIVIKDKLGIIC